MDRLRQWAAGRPGAGFACLLAVAGAVLTGLWFLSSETPATLRGDNKLFLFPMALDAYRQWMSGRIPYWTNGQWLGFPLVAEPMAGVFYLPNALGFLLTADPHLHAFDLSTALHIGIITAGTVLFMGQLGVGRLAAAYATLLTLQAPHVLGWTFFQPSFCALAWWPWVMLAAGRIAQAGRPALPGLLLGSAALGAQVLAGYPEFALYSGSLAAAWIVGTRRGLSIGACGARLVALVVLTALFAAPQLIATASEIPDTGRAERGALDSLLSIYPAGGGGIVHPRAAATVFPLVSPFLGAATLGLAVVAILARVPSALTLMVAAVVCAALSLGEQTPLYGLVTRIPPFHFFRGPHKFFVVTQLAVIWLAALGVQQLLFAGVRWRRLGVSMGLLLGLASVTEYGTQCAGQLRQLWVPRRPDAFTLPADLESLRLASPILTRRENPDGPPPRVLAAAGPFLFGSLGMIHGVEGTRGGYTPLLSPRVVHLTRGPLTPAHLDALGVQLVFAPRNCQQGPGRGFETVWHDGQACVQRNPSSPRRYVLVDDVVEAASEEKMLAVVEQNPQGPVPVMTGTSDLPRVDGEPGQGSVIVASYAPGTVRLRVRTPHARLLLVRESWKRGWRAWVDDEPTSIQRAAGVFFVVPVPPGEHVVRLEFRPPGMAVGFALWAAWLGIAVIAMRHPARRG